MFLFSILSKSLKKKLKIDFCKKVVVNPVSKLNAVSSALLLKYFFGQRFLITP